MKQDLKFFNFAGKQDKHPYENYKALCKNVNLKVEGQSS